MLTAGSGVYQDCDSPLCLAAAVAGKLLSRSAPDESLSAAVLEGLSAVSPARSEAEIETLLRGGVVPAEWVGGQAECIRGVTTRTKNGSAPDSTWRDITTLLTVDHIMQAVRQMLTEKLRGVRSSQQSLESVASQVTVLLQQKEEEGLLEDWSDPVVYTRPEDASVCVVELSFAVAPCGEPHHRHRLHYALNRGFAPTPPGLSSGLCRSQPPIGVCFFSEKEGHRWQYFPLQRIFTSKWTDAAWLRPRAIG